MKKIYLFGALLTASISFAQQTLPFTDSFSYASGNLHTTTPWSVMGTAHASDHILLDGSQVTFGGLGTDAQLLLSPQPIATGTVYYSFKITIPSTADLALLTDAAGGYLAGFNQNAANNTFGGSLWIKKDASDATNTKFAFGTEVRTATGANTSLTTYDYVKGTTYTVVVGYTFNSGGTNDDTSKLWINPTAADENSPLLTDTHTGVDLTTLYSFFFRQDSATETPSEIIIDDLKLSTTFTEVLKTEKFDNIPGLSLHPNPTKQLLNITSASFAEKQVVLYDVLGKVALSTKVTNQPINVTSLPKGVYVAKITEEGKIATRKVVIE